MVYREETPFDYRKTGSQKIHFGNQKDPQARSLLAALSGPLFWVPFLWPLDLLIANLFFF